MRWADVDPETNRITGVVVDSAIAVHRALKMGATERVYRDALVHELRKRGLRVGVEVTLPAVYDGIVLEAAYVMDLVVESRVVVEIKAVAGLHAAHVAQLYNYLALSRHEVGLLLNFNVQLMKEGILRVKRKA